MGPTVLTGEHLGPIFYYLIGPSFILSNFNPLGPAIFMAFMGVATVALLYLVASRIWGIFAGLSISLLYAVTPWIVSADRILWEPNLIPIFVLLFMWSMYEIRNKYNPKYFVLLGLSNGILVQLHYPNIFFIGISLLFAIYMLAFAMRQKNTKKSIFVLLLWMIVGFISFFLILFPFLYYEHSHQYEDLKGVMFKILFGSGAGDAGLPLRERFIDILTKTTGKVFPIKGELAIGIFTLMTLIISLSKVKLWDRFIVGVCFIGIVAMSLFKGYVYDHYLLFLLPLSFLLVASFLSLLEKKTSRILLGSLIIILALVQLWRTDIFTNGNHDVPQTESITRHVIQTTNGLPFSFTIISSRSFSDLHHRFFYETQNIIPINIHTPLYNDLFVICEKAPCDNVDDLLEKRHIPVMCYEPHCSGEYGTIDLASFSSISTVDIGMAKVYQFKRAQ